MTLVIWLETQESSYIVVHDIVGNTRSVSFSSTFTGRKIRKNGPTKFSYKVDNSFLQFPRLSIFQTSNLKLHVHLMYDSKSIKRN